LLCAQPKSQLYSKGLGAALKHGTYGLLPNQGNAQGRFGVRILSWRSDSNGEYAIYHKRLGVRKVSVALHARFRAIDNVRKAVGIG
ncbi:hypothetical protein D7I41_15940, partial [Ochrobactrum sp. MH181795]